MLRQREQLYRGFFLLADIFVTLLSFGAALGIRAVLPGVMSIPLIGPMPPLGPTENYVILLPPVVLMWSLLLFVFDTQDFRLPLSTMSLRYAKTAAAGGACLIGLAFAAQLPFFPRSLILLFTMVNIATLIATRFLLLALASGALRRRADGHRILIVGTGPDAMQILQAVRVNRVWGFRVVGFVCSDDAREALEQSAIDGVPVLGQVRRIGDVLAREPVDTAVFALGARQGTTLDDAMAVCEERGVRVSIALFPFLHASPRMTLERIESIPMLTFARTPTNELALLAKRGMDIIGSGLALLLLSPLLLLAMLAIRCDSAGPLIYKQTRAGRMGRRFTLYKFRSMVVDAEANIDSLKARNEMDGPMFKIRNDPRITRVGKIIRKMSIDELPQLVNVLRGEMSLVGPRPSLPDEIERFEPWQRRRLSMKPGITCIWQVSGRNNVDFDRWMKMDLQYIDNWSLWLDVKLLARTVPVVLLGSGAS